MYENFRKGFMLKVESFKKIFPSCKSPENVVAILNKFFVSYNVNSLNRISAFLAEAGIESGGFTTFAENLNYKAVRLCEVFEHYFSWDTKVVQGVTVTVPGALALVCAMNPEKIANIVYASRMGNGDTTSGDGYRYRGRGAFQTTGKNNYTAFGKSIKKSPEDTATYMETLDGAIESAFYYWCKNNLNTYADKDDIDDVSHIINGGTIGLNERHGLYIKIQTILKGTL